MLIRTVSLKPCIDLHFTNLSLVNEVYHTSSTLIPRFVAFQPLRTHFKYGLKSRELVLRQSIEDETNELSVYCRHV